MFDIAKVTIKFDKNVLSKLKDFVKSWVQLEVIKEKEDSITVKGRRKIVELMLYEISMYSKRHNGTYKVKWEEC